MPIYSKLIKPKVSGKKNTDQDAVEIYFDFFNDKFPKYLEDDFIIRISCEGKLSGQGTYQDRLKAYASSYCYSKDKTKTGYTVELALYIGGIPIENDSSSGIEFCINDAISPDNLVKHRIFWSEGRSKRSRGVEVCTLRI